MPKYSFGVKQSSVLYNLVFPSVQDRSRSSRMQILLGFLTLVAVVCNGIELDGPLDLSWPYDHTSKVCAGGQDFEFIKKENNTAEGGIWYSHNTFRVAEHCGTHIDAPYHFHPEGLTVEKIPLNKLLVTGVVIDVAEETGDNQNYTMPLSKVEEWEKVHGPLPDNSVIIIRFGWSSKYEDKEAYILKDGVYRHPGVDTKVSQYFVDSQKVVGVGMDGPSIDPGYDMKYTSHQILLKAGLYILENVSVMAPLPPLIKLIVAPMKIAHGTGGPVRLIALPINYTF